MATSSYKTFLMHSTDGTDYTKLAPIKNYPDLGGEPEMLETTTLEDGVATNIVGIQSSDSKTFTMNYDKTVYTSLKALEGSEQYFAVWFGGTLNSDGTVTPTGSEGKFEFKGTISTYATGHGVNEVREMVSSIAVAGQIAFKAS